jgi:hypothetical protein
LLLTILIAALYDAREGRASPGLDRRYLALGLVPIAVGFGLRALVVGTAPRGTSGRSTRELVAAELNTGGLYSMVRHPLYLANLLLWIGLATTTGSWWVVPVIGLAFFLAYRSIIAAEEAFLARRFGATYHGWAERTPALWPNPRRWRPAALPFSLKIVLRQEYYGLFTVVLFLAVLELAANVIDRGRWEIGTAWILLLAVTTVTTGLLRLLQRHTTLLDVEGR